MVEQIAEPHVVYFLKVLVLTWSGWLFGQHRGTNFISESFPSKPFSKGTFLNSLNVHGGMGWPWGKQAPVSITGAPWAFPTLRGSAAWFEINCSEWLSFTCPAQHCAPSKHLDSYHDKYSKQAIHALPMISGTKQKPDLKTKWWGRHGLSALPWIMYDFC